MIDPGKAGAGPFLSRDQRIPKLNLEQRVEELLFFYVSPAASDS